MQCLLPFSEDLAQPGFWRLDAFQQLVPAHRTTLFFDVDVSLMKDIRIKERLTLSFGASAVPGRGRIASLRRTQGLSSILRNRIASVPVRRVVTATNRYP